MADVSKTFKRVNLRKAAGPDGIPSRFLKACTDQLAGVFTDILNCLLSQSVAPISFKMATIVPVPKKAKITELNDYHPVALTSVMKCFERLVKDHTTSTLPATQDPLQFAYRPNSSTDDAIAITLHTALSHLDKRNKYVRQNKEIIVDLAEGAAPYPNRRDSSGEGERFKFLGIHITDKLKLSTHTDSVAKKAQQCLFNLRRLKQCGLSLKALTNFYRCTIESILSGCITDWFGNCTALNSKAPEAGAVCTTHHRGQTTCPP
jgi:hypothetical protein